MIELNKKKEINNKEFRRDLLMKPYACAVYHAAVLRWYILDLFIDMDNKKEWNER